MASRSRLSVQARRVDSYPWSPFRTFEVTNTSSRGSPLSRTAMPTCFSFPYALAVSRRRYPIRSASWTARTHSSPFAPAVPRPRTGMRTSLFRVTRDSREIAIVGSGNRVDAKEPDGRRSGRRPRGGHASERTHLVHFRGELPDRHEHRSHEQAADVSEGRAREDAHQVRRLVPANREELREAVNRRRQHAGDHDECSRALSSEPLEVLPDEQWEHVQHDLTRTRGRLREHDGQDAEVREDVHGRHARVDRHLVSVEPEGAEVELVALRIPERVHDAGVHGERLPDVPMVDEVRPADLVREGSGRDRVWGDEQGCGPDEVQDEQGEERLAPREAPPGRRGHASRYEGGSNKPFSSRRRRRGHFAYRAGFFSTVDLQPGEQK